MQSRIEDVGLPSVSFEYPLRTEIFPNRIRMSKIVGTTMTIMFKNIPNDIVTSGLPTGASFETGDVAAFPPM
jgi:hypothetical protein